MSPSLLSADLSDLNSAIRKVEDAGCEFVHIDVMDGHFVPQISYGQPVVKALRPRTGLSFDVHLMVEHPEDMVESFADSGADLITFHIESTVHVHRLVQKIRSMGKRAGVAVVPSTPVSALSEILPDVDLVLVMAVNPGFGGQKLIPSCLRKVSELRSLREASGRGYLISVDGGVNSETVDSVVASGADIVVSGSAFFGGTFEWKY